MTAAESPANRAFDVKGRIERVAPDLLFRTDPA